MQPPRPAREQRRDFLAWKPTARAWCARSCISSATKPAPPQAISDLRDAVDGGILDDQGVVVGGKANLVPADDNGRTYSRTTRQVLNIVYLRKNAMSGGFFPAGLNGAIK